MAIINKYAFCKLTERPFVWLPTYTADLLTLGSFTYTFGWHVLWMNSKNAGLGLDGPNPS